MNIREILTSQSDDSRVATEIDARRRLVSTAQEGQGSMQASGVNGESDLISRGTLPFVQIHHQKYVEKDAFGRAVDCSHQKFMHTFFSGMTQEELIAKSYLGGLAAVGIGAVVSKYSPRVGQALMLGGATGNIFGALEGLRYLNGVNDFYSQAPNCRIFGGSERR